MEYNPHNKACSIFTEHGLFTYATVNPLINGWKSTSGKYHIKPPKTGNMNSL